MKLAACYSIFDGLELLKPSIDQIYPFVDVIIIGYQLTGWNGNSSSEIGPYIERMLTGEHADKLKFVEYVPLINKTPKDNEMSKHNAMLTAARDAGCTHFFMSATDHFYLPEQLIRCIDIAAEFDVTFTRMFTYYKHPTWQLTPMEEYLMPFIMKIHPQTEFLRCKYPVVVDPALKVNTCGNWLVFPVDQLVLHHMSMIRINIREKMQNSVSLGYWPQGSAERFIKEFESYSLEENPGVEYFQGRKVQVVDNYFEL
jgi:hypothetical protein